MAKAKPTTSKRTTKPRAKPTTATAPTHVRQRAARPAKPGTSKALRVPDTDESTSEVELVEKLKQLDYDGSTAPAIDPQHTQGANTPTTETETDSDEDRAGIDAGATVPCTPHPASITGENKEGDVSTSVAMAGPPNGPSGVANLACETTKQDAHRRWRNEGIAERVAAFRDRLRMEHRKANPKAKRSEGNEYAWAMSLAAFPPPGVEPIEPEPVIEADPEPPPDEPIEQPAPQPAAPIPPTPVADDGVPGLGDMPSDWPTLSANASLQVEIAWVSANRLRVRDGSGVDLSRALSPAPSYSALSWLETSILFPSKFADISVKASQNQEDEKEHIRREKLSIEEIRGLLSEMMEG